MREEFENAWASSMCDAEGRPGNRPLRSTIYPDRYRGNAANFAWTYWRASREALEIVLPDADDAFEYRHGGTTYFDGAGYREACTKAIEAAGLKVSP